MTWTDDSDPRLDAMMYGVEALDDRSLLSMLLGRARGSPPPDELAGQVIEHAGGMAGLARFGPAAFAAIPGLGQARALRLASSVELGRRIAERAAQPGEPLDRPAVAAAFLAPRIGVLEHEEMWVLSLDGRQRLRGMRRVAHGGLHAMSLSPGDVLRAALWDGASGFVIAHNHPSGCSDPSREDVETTVRIGCAAEAIGVPLLDHLIVTASGEYVSMMELGVIGKRKPPSDAEPRAG